MQPESSTVPGPVEKEIIKDANDGGEETDGETKSVPLHCWAILLISSVGVFMAAVSTSALIIAFPVIILDLQVTIATMMWILLSVLLVIGAMVGIAGKLGDVFGQAFLFKFGYATFIIGCLGGGFCTQEQKGMDLVAARVIIGFGAAFLFTNSSAILTNAFAKYNLVGLSQGVFQLSAAMGMVLGPLIGGSFAQTNWRWIFWYNVPLGGPLALLALWVVHDGNEVVHKTWIEHAKTFDWIGAFCCPAGLILLLTAMLQGVSPTYPLANAGPLAGLITGGCVAGVIFIVDQFYCVSPLFPPEMFLTSRAFSVSTAGGTCMGFVRNSITYNMIFYLQGPHSMNPYQVWTNYLNISVAACDALTLCTLVCIIPSGWRCTGSVWDRCYGGRILSRSIGR